MRQRKVPSQTKETSPKSKNFPEPVAPWNFKSITDKGPVSELYLLCIHVGSGILFSVLYHYTGYFDQITPWVAYGAIWIPLWFSLMSRLSPQNQLEHDSPKQCLQEELASALTD